MEDPRNVWRSLRGLVAWIISNQNKCLQIHNKRTGKREVTIRNSDLAKFGTKAERQTDLQIYTNRGPKIPSGKITEDLIKQHAREARRKLEGNKKIKHKIAGDMSAVSSIHSNVTRALRARIPVKPKKPGTCTATATNRECSRFRTTSRITTYVYSIAEPPTRLMRKAATKATEALQPTQKRKRSSPSITESDESLASTQRCPPTVSSTSTLSRQKRRQLINQQQRQNKSIESTIQKAATNNQNVESDFTVGPCWPVKSFPTQYYISPNYEGPETSMTVGEAERIYESDSD